MININILMFYGMKIETLICCFANRPQGLYKYLFRP